ncbi:hypothetical protein Leryth_001990 [Lithospermum erythrorhizon]|uniref:Uncharacterized protein n=1 Tax=Lithospermum erythrorhizon TaxID=34254 RepID=A0AAV3QHH0_LITER|nr:hypothetical protein Leryth_001990 [Lithospermum erythrorhizon]
MLIYYSPIAINLPNMQKSHYKIVLPSLVHEKRPVSFLVSASCRLHASNAARISKLSNISIPKLSFQLSLAGYEIVCGKELEAFSTTTSSPLAESSRHLMIDQDITKTIRPLICLPAFSFGSILWLESAKAAEAVEKIGTNSVYEVGELFELGIQLTYLLLLLALLGVGSFYVIRQVLVRRELDLSAKELQEQVRSGDASATGLFELGAVMLRRKYYPAATKYLLQAIDKWDGDDQDLAQVYNALGVSYVRDGKLEKGISQFETAVKLQPGYVTAWNNLGDAYEEKKEYKSALKAFEEVLLFDPNNKIARPRRDALKDKVTLYRDVPVNTKKR